jgi:hypothetical protein
VNTPDLQAICDTCLTVIADGAGHVWVDQAAAHTSIRELRAQQAEPGAGIDVHTWYDDDLAGTKWHTTHDTCAPEAFETSYAIPVERINTWPAVVHWTAHLMHKGWLEATDWDMFTLRTVEPQRATVSGLRPIRPQDLDFRGIGS